MNLKWFFQQWFEWFLQQWFIVMLGTMNLESGPKKSELKRWFDSLHAKSN